MHKTRLDRMLVLKEWLQLWPTSSQYVLSGSIFLPMSLGVKIQGCKLGSKTSPGFK